MSREGEKVGKASTIGSKISREDGENLSCCRGEECQPPTGRGTRSGSEGEAVEVRSSTPSRRGVAEQ